MLLKLDRNVGSGYSYVMFAALSVPDSIIHPAFDSAQKALVYSCLISQVGSVNTGQKVLHT